MRFLFLLFVLLPVIEIYVLIEIGSLIGALPTIGIILITAVIGYKLFRAQGLEKLQNIRSGLSGAPQGQNIAMEMAEGAFILVAGALLLTPGFVTDAFGFACLIPPIRKVMIKKAVAHSIFRVSKTGFQNQSYSSRTQTTNNNNNVIEGEYKEK